MKKILVLVAALLLLSLSPGAAEQAPKGKMDKREQLINYNQVLYNEYKLNVGRPVPFTIEQSIQIEGTFTRDGLYFFYASDRDRGNYDIYLRSITGIQTVRITDHPSKDTSPAPSPDGKSLAFISQRDDPEGDVFIVKLDAGTLLDRAGRAVSGITTFEGKAKNLTEIVDPVTRARRIVKDASPSWSPDSGSILYSSARDGLENIWIMDRSGKNRKQLTRKGGTVPRFSEDGKKIVFISYREEKSNGDVYVLDLKSGEEKRITSGPDIELNPCFQGTTGDIVYTLINRDTNGDGVVSMKDSSILYSLNPETGKGYALTVYSQSSFDARWSPAFNGILIYSMQTGQSINIHVIPADGVIPKRESALRQYNLASQYITEFDDEERSLLCLENVYRFFGGTRDRESVTFTARALFDAAVRYRDQGRSDEAARMSSLLASMSRDRDDYSSIRARCLEDRLKGRKADSVLAEAVRDIRTGSKKEKMDYLPYVNEDLGDEYLRLGMREKGAAVYQRVLKEFPAFKLAPMVHLKYAVASQNRLEAELSPSYVMALESAFTDVRNNAALRILDLFDSYPDRQGCAKIAMNMIIRHRDSKLLPGLLHCAIGRALADAGDSEGAKRHLRQALELVAKNFVVYYRANVLLGDLAERERKPAEREKHYFSAATSYLLFWKQSDIRKVAKELIGYYEEFGERAELSGNYREAAELYGRYIRLLTYLHGRKRFEDIYNEYGARAHVLYIDAYSEWKGSAAGELAALEAEYTSKESLDNARLEFDKAYLYGLGYIYANEAIAQEREATIPAIGRDRLLQYFKKAMFQLDWALFIDDRFIDPYILQGWIGQYVDLRRKEDKKSTGGKNTEAFNSVFPRHLWEKNIGIYEKALSMNDESRNPETEGNLHLNLANTYFLITNYPRALKHYELADRYKKNFGSRQEEAMFHYHLGYCYWQDARYDDSRNEMKKSLQIYLTLASGRSVSKYRNQIYYLYRFFGLLARMQRDYKEAIAWYNRTLDFAREQHIDIDRARFFQEIAYCYKESGETGRALAYLGKAQKILNRAEDVKKEYNVGLKVFVFGPFPVWDMGPDKAVIGDNKIFTELDTYNKRLLNLSLFEEIYYTRGSFAKSIGYLQKKLDEIGERSTQADIEARIRTLNNIGFCHFRARNFYAAGKYFQRAWDYAADPDVDNLRGVFVSIINYTNLHAYLIENGIGDFTTSKKDIDVLLAKIAAYRDGYEKKRYEQELKTLEEEARLKKRKATAEEKAELSERIASEAVEVYYSIDIAIGVLQYFKADLMAIREAPQKERPAAWTAYGASRDLYLMYSGARIRFEKALGKAETIPSKRLMVRLLVNIGACLEATGAYDDAYENYANAEKAAADMEYDDLLWSVEYTIASFLSRNGASVEGKGYLEVAEEYFSKALARIEEYPALYADSVSRVRHAYDEYCMLLVRRGNWKKAAAVAENAYSVQRIMLVALESPEFHTRADEDDYKVFLERVSAVRGSWNALTAALEGGEQAASDAVKQLREELGAKKRELKGFTSGIVGNRPVFASFMTMPEAPAAGYRDSIVYRFFLDRGKTSGWRHDGKKAEFRELGTLSGEGRAALQKAIKSFVEGDDAGTGSGRRFIVLDDAAERLFLKNGLHSGIAPFTFVPSVERVRYYLNSEMGAVSGVYVTGSGMKDRLTGSTVLKGVAVREGRSDRREMLFSSIIIDNAAGEEAVTPAIFFNTRMSPQLLIKKINDPGAEGIAIIMESALYAGVRTILFTSGLADSAIAGLLEKSLEGTIDTIGPVSDKGDASALPAGFRGFSAAERAASMEKLTVASWERYHESMKAGRFTEAAMHLARWRDLLSGDLTIRPAYSLLSAEIELLQERYGDALASSRTAFELSVTGMAEINRRALLFVMYAGLYTGDVNLARSMLDENASRKDISNTVEYRILAGIADLAAGRSAGNPEDIFSGADKTVFLPLPRLRLLAAEYCILLGRTDKARRIITAGAAMDAVFNERESCRIRSLGGKEPVKEGMSTRSRAIRSLLSEEGGAEQLILQRAQRLADVEGRYDSLSYYPLRHALGVLADRNSETNAVSLIESLDLDEIASACYWMDGLDMMSAVEAFYAANDRRGDVLVPVDLSLQLLKNRPVQEARARLQLVLSSVMLDRKKNAESLAAAQNGLSVAGKDDASRMPFELLILENEIALGRLDNAEKDAQRLEGMAGGDYRYAIGMLRARIRAARILAKKTATDEEWREIERLTMEGLGSIDGMPGVLERYNRGDLVEGSLDIVMSYRMSKNDYLGALLIAEVKKQIIARSRFPLLAREHRPSEAVIREFRSLVDRNRDAGRFIELMGSHPSLRINAFAGMLPVAAFQKKIPSSDVVLYLVKNEADIFAWVISRDFIEPVRIRGGFNRVMTVVETYRELLARFENTASVSKDLALIFKPLERFFGAAGTISIITDGDLEDVPFEIMGDKQMLGEAHPIVFRESILASFRTYAAPVPAVRIIDTPDKAVFHALEEVAIRQCGIPVEMTPRTERRVSHVFPVVRYGSRGGELYAGPEKLGEVLNGSGMAYFSSADFPGALGFNDLSLYCSMLGIGQAVFNDASIHDVNNAVFIDWFYSGLAGGMDVAVSFEKARSVLRGKDRFRYPAYWSGIRLYLNGM